MTPRTVDRVAADARAAALARRSLQGEARAAGLRLAIALMDLTSLEGKDSPERIRALCRKAAQPDPDRPDLPPVAAVCVYPRLVATACAALAGTPVRVASVAAGFPSGQTALSSRLAETEEALRAGAAEVDMVISRGAFLAGRHARVAEEIREVRALCGSARLKVILETAELETYDAVRATAELAIESGADFLKTSTGKVEPAATMGATLLLLETVRDHARAGGRRIGVKAAGGIRSAKQALHLLVMVKETVGEAWLQPNLFRLGASALLNDVLLQIRALESGVGAASYDVTEA
jgi:deoxyribose-phosphate aldolase